jgi:Ca-activated chloride channel family protein
LVIILLVGGFDTGLGKSKIGTKMETVKREGIDIVFAMDISKVCLQKMLLLAD